MMNGMGILTIGGYGGFAEYKETPASLQLHGCGTLVNWSHDSVLDPTRAIMLVTILGVDVLL